MMAGEFGAIDQILETLKGPVNHFAWYVWPLLLLSLLLPPLLMLGLSFPSLESLLHPTRSPEQDRGQLHSAQFKSLLKASLQLPFLLLCNTFLQVVGRLRLYKKCLDYKLYRPLPHGLLEPHHPWLTGKIPGTQDDVWPKNILFASPQTPAERAARSALESDDKIVTSLGRTLRNRISHKAKSRINGPLQEILQDLPRPVSQDYFLGTLHYNGAFLIFNHPREALAYLSTPSFRQNLFNIIKSERRQILLVFRNRHSIETRDLLLLKNSLKAHFTWPLSLLGANGQDRTLHCPYPALLLQTDHWPQDLRDLQIDPLSEDLLQPPLRSKIDKSYSASSLMASEFWVQMPPEVEKNQRDFILWERILTLGEICLHFLQSRWSRKRSVQVPNNVYCLNEYRQRLHRGRHPLYSSGHGPEHDELGQ